MRLALAVLLVLTPLSGCLGAGPYVASEPDLGWPVLPTGAPTADEIAARTLDEPPEWRLGQWFTYAVSHLRTGITFDTTVVVAGARDDMYLVGVPADDFDDAAIITHLPFLGAVGRDDMSWAVHDARFAPLSFPLTSDASWETRWQNPGDMVTASVVDANDTHAEIQMVGARLIDLSYDARRATITAFSIEGYGSFTLTDAGYAYTGPVIVLDEITPVILESRVLAVQDGSSGIAAPITTLQVDSGLDKVSVFLMMGSTVAPTPGLYRVQATAPDGTAFEVVDTTLQPEGVRWGIWHHDVVKGAWDLEYVIAGPGFGFVEAIAYAWETHDLTDD